MPGDMDLLHLARDSRPDSKGSSNRIIDYGSNVNLITPFDRFVEFLSGASEMQSVRLAADPVTLTTHIHHSLSYPHSQV